MMKSGRSFVGGGDKLPGLGKGGGEPETEREMLAALKKAYAAADRRRRSK